MYMQYSNFIYALVAEINASNIVPCHLIPMWLWTAEIYSRQSQNNLKRITNIHERREDKRDL